MTVTAMVPVATLGWEVGVSSALTVCKATNASAITHTIGEKKLTRRGISFLQLF
jgi:hypothetical protein